MACKVMKLVIIILLLFIFTGCATTGPLFKPSYNTRLEYINAHPELSQEIKQAILEGRVIEGMTKEDVIATWGKPDKVTFMRENKDSYFYTEEWDEVWYYKDTLFRLMSPSIWVYFKKGVVVGIERGCWYEA